MDRENHDLLHSLLSKVATMESWEFRGVNKGMHISISKDGDSISWEIRKKSKVTEPITGTADVKK